MLLERITWRVNFCARKFISLVAFEHEKTPKEDRASASLARSSPSAARERASSHVVGRSSPSVRTSGTVSRVLDRMPHLPSLESLTEVSERGAGWRARNRLRVVRLIVLCYDDSEPSRHAIAEAAKLFPDAKAKVLHVWRSIESTLAFRYSAAGLTGALRDAIDELESGGREAAEEIAQRGAQLARDAGFDAEPYALEARDRVDEAVAEIVESWDASAVVV